MSYPIEVLARTIYGEARGESYEGKVAVAWTIRNRAEKGGWWGDTIASVCHQDRQYSCWNLNDPNRKHIERVGLENKAFRRCFGIACLVLSDAESDPTSKATHYHTKSISPPWSQGLEPCYEVGSHVFFNNVR